MCGGGPKVDTTLQDHTIAEAERARQEEIARQARISEGMSSIAKVFDGMDPVLDQRRAAMEGFYIPQLDKKYSEASDATKFALARAGQSVSSTAGKKNADLAEAFGLERASIDSKIQGDVSNTETRMNQSRSALEAALRASGDATAASNASLQQAVTFRAEQPELNPLGDIFLGAAQGIGALKQGQEFARVSRLSTPKPLSSGTGRVVN